MTLDEARAAIGRRVFFDAGLNIFWEGEILEVRGRTVVVDLVHHDYPVTVQPRSLSLVPS